MAHGPILRPQLFDLLDAGKDDALTLVSAPPGYGKSVLLTTWLSDRKPSFGWVSLDDNDNDAKVFLEYLVAAIQKQHPHACPKIAHLLNHPQALDLTKLASTLTEEIIACEKPILLILDDFHLIRNKEIHSFISELIKNSPPLFRLIILTRRDPPLPLNTLRSQGGLAEIRMQDLRFQPEEAKEFLSSTTQDSLSPQTLQNLDKRLEGWAAGLRLVSLNLRYCTDVNQFLGELKGGPQAVREYLMNEVLAHQPEMFRKCLLKVAALDRFSGPLCKYLCISTDPDLESQCRQQHGDGEFPLMANLLESNLFVISLDDEGVWYRFHHLFQNFLRDRLKNENGEETLAVLHSHAADWFDAQGLIEEAVSYSLKGTDPGDAVQLVIKNRHSLMQLEQEARLGRLINMLPPEQVANEPELLLQQAWMILELLDFDGDNVLNQAESLINKMPPDTPGIHRLQGQLHAMRSLQYYEITKSTEARRLTESALKLLDDDQWVERGIAMIIQVFSLQMEGRMNEAESVVFDAFEKKGIQETAFHTRLLAALAFIHWREADLEGVTPVVSKLEHLGRKLGFAETIAHALYFQGIVHSEQGNPDKAEDPLTEMLEDYKEANPENSAHTAFALALTYEAQNRPREAQELAEQVIHEALELQSAPLLSAAEAFQAEIHMRQGRMAEASLWAKNFDRDPRRSYDRFFVPHITLAKVLLKEGTRTSLKKLAQLLNQLEKIYTDTHNQRILIYVLVIKALLLQKLEKEKDSLTALHQAISISQPGGFIQLFVDAGPELIPLLNRLELTPEGIEYVGRILAGYKSARKRTSSETTDSARTNNANIATDDPLIDPLTERELEVLNLLAQRLSNKEIAERLFIAPGTVKRHTNTLYRKLNVHGRRNAVAKAQGLGFLKGG
ncbi:MAG: winged helix-turn-helix transcriptional regulator [Verrucomicrobia bacterium]|nr:winged helix-turn-helix transcriptional regulator [Verrucomicrobiota bacterium]